MSIDQLDLRIEKSCQIGLNQISEPTLDMISGMMSGRVCMNNRSDIGCNIGYDIGYDEYILPLVQSDLATGRADSATEFSCDLQSCAFHRDYGHTY